MGDEICPDFHVCRNGSKCLESFTREGAFYCDCDNGVGDGKGQTAFAGVSCEHESTIFCNDWNQKSYTSFCTNGGTCKQNVAVHGQHKGCNCPGPYTGDFCQFLVGQKVPQHIGNGIGVSVGITNNGDGSNSLALSAVVLAIALTLVAGLATYCSFRVKRSSSKSSKTDSKIIQPSLSTMPYHHHHHHKMHHDDLILEADGSVLKAAVDEEMDIPPPEPFFLFGGDSNEHENYRTSGPYGQPQSVATKTSKVPASTTTNNHNENTNMDTTTGAASSNRNDSLGRKAEII